jgi:hypothetical protein
VRLRFLVVVIVGSPRRGSGAPTDPDVRISRIRLFVA